MIILKNNILFLSDLSDLLIVKNSSVVILRIVLTYFWSIEKGIKYGKRSARVDLNSSQDFFRLSQSFTKRYELSFATFASNLVIYFTELFNIWSKHGKVIETEFMYQCFCQLIRKVDNLSINWL